MPKYTYTEYVAVQVTVYADDADDAQELGSEYVDALLYDAKTLRERAKQIDSKEVKYKGADSTGDGEVEQA